MTIGRKPRKPLPRYAKLPRGGRLRSSVPVIRFNRKKRKATFARAYGSAERVAFVASLPCACGCGRFPCENAHVVKGDGGMSRKASARYIAPLFHDCHETLHRCGPASFEALYGIDLAACAARTEAAWQAWKLEIGQAATCDPSFCPELVP